MKVILLGMSLLFLCVFPLFSIGFSFFLAGGHAFGTDGEALGTRIETSDGSYNLYTNTSTKPGTSLRGIGSADIWFSDSFGVTVGAGYLVGPLVRLPFIYYETSDVPDRTAYVEWSFIPVWTTIRGRVSAGKFSIDVGVGPTAAFNGRSIVTDSWTSNNDSYWEIEGTSTIGWGFHGVVGAEFELSRRFAIRMEARGEHLTFRPKSAVITKYTENGEDRLESEYPTVADRETVFVEDLSEYLNAPYNPDLPGQQLAYNISADSIGVYLGIVIRVPGAAER